MTHAEQVMQEALSKIVRDLKQSERHVSRLSTMDRAILSIAEDALTYAWDDEKPAVDDL